MFTRIDAKWIFPIYAEPIHNGTLIVSGGGIEYVGPRKNVNCAAFVEAKEGKNLTLLPGLVNSHCHLELSSMNGKVGKGDSFINWIKKVIEFRKEMSGENIISSIEYGIVKAVESGTTCFGEYSSTGLSGERLMKAGIRARVFSEFSGFQNALTEERLEHLKKKVTTFPTKTLIEQAVAPHAPYSVSPKLIRESSRYAFHNRLPFSIHLAEIHEEIEFLNGMEGTMYALLNLIGVWDPNWNPPKCSSIQYMESLGALNNCLAIHVNYADKNDINLLKDNNCTIIRCPGSNKWFKREDTAPLPNFLQHNIPVALGTDGLSSNEELSLFREMRLVKELYPELEKKEILKMATINGAKALRLDEKIGTLEHGKRADLVGIVSNRNDKEPHDTLFDPGIIVQFTMVEGKVVFKNMSKSLTLIHHEL